MDLSNIPKWVWIAGGGIVVVGAVLLTRKSSSVDTTGQSSPFTDSLNSLLTELSNLQGQIQNGGMGSSTGKSGGGSGGGTNPSGIGHSAQGTPDQPPTLLNPPTRPTGIQGTPDQPPTRLNPPNPISGPGGLAQPLDPTKHVLAAPTVSAGTGFAAVTAKPLVKASSVSPYIGTATKAREGAISTAKPSVISRYVQPIYTRITSGRYTGKQVPLEYAPTSAPKFYPSNPISGAGGLAQRTSPTTTQVTSGRYAGKTVPL